ncbi:MAG: acyl-CoA dehydrogenase, partial [Myxococcales bacterium]|nr:acyl-CoA dehydrogenase [Myxococcales bacterium]
MKLSRALAWILSAPSDISPIPDLAAWWRGHVALAADDAITRAALGGFAADRFAYAFASGYQAALERLTGGPPHVRRSLCATEERGAHPRAIACALREEEDGARLRGEKRWASLGAEADELLVVAQAARQRGPRPELVVVALPSARAGVRFDAL